MRLTLLFCFITVSVFCQEYNLEQYSPVDGLPQMRISGIAIDNLGYVWVGTSQNGVAKFDGKDFKSLSVRDGLLSNQVSSVHSWKNSVYIIHPNGVTLYAKNEFHEFHHKNTEPLIDGFVTGKKFYARSSKNLYELNAADSTLVLGSQRNLRPETISMSTTSGDHTVLFYDSVASVYNNDGNLLEVLLPHGFDKKVISTFAFEDKIIVSTGQRAFEFDGNQLRARPDLPSNCLSYNNIDRSFIKYENGNIYSIHATTGRQQLLMRDVIVNQLILDQSGVVWVATEGAGLIRLTAKQYSLQNFRGVSAIEKDNQGNIWVGSYFDGLWKITDFQKPTQITKKVSDVSVLDVLETNGKVLCSHTKGLSLIANDKLSNPFIKEQLYALSAEENGGVWCASSDGLLFYQENLAPKWYRGHEGKPLGRLSFVYHWAGKAVVFGNSNSVYLLRNEVIQICNIPAARNTPVTSVSAYQDSLLLLATAGAGLLVVGDDMKLRASLSTENGLPSNFINSVGVDSNSDVWIGSNLGISKIKFDSLVGIKSISNQPIASGTNSMEAMNDSFCLKGEKLFGLVDGLYRVLEPKSRTLEFPLHFTEIFIGTKKVVGDFSEIRIPGGNDAISISFSKISRELPNSASFSYLLSPRDMEWSRASSANNAVYSGLDPGEYTFLVRAVSSDGTWTRPITISLVITPLFYQTAVFRIMVVALSIALIGLFLYWRIRHKSVQLLQAERQIQESNARIRKEIARDFHDETGNQLSLIINYSSLLKAQKGAQGTDSLVEVIEESAQKLYYGTKDFIWSIDPVNDDVTNLFVHVKDLGEKLFDSTNVIFRASTNVTDSIQLPLGASRQISLIFREALNNAFKHARASNISFSIEQKDAIIEFTLQDDGSGYKQDNVKPGGGLNNMSHRAAKLGAALLIDSVIGKGTTILLRYGH